MGIGNDIRPKKATAPDREPDLRSEDELTETDLSDINHAPDKTSEDSAPVVAEDKVEIPIDKDGIGHPVYEDLLPKSPKPFEHLEADRPSDEADLEKPSFLKFKPEPVGKDEKPIAKEDSFRSFTEYHQKQPKKSHLLTIIIIIFVFLLATLLVLQNLDQIKDMIGIKSEQKSDPKPISSGVEVIGSNDFKSDNTASTSPSTASNSTSASSTASTPTATPTPATPTPAPSITAPAEVKIRVLNGNGISGSAASVKNTLTAAGYSIPSVSNAARFTYTKTMIYYNTGKKAEADAVAAVLSNRTTEVVLNASVAGTSDVIVVVGKS